MSESQKRKVSESSRKRQAPRQAGRVVQAPVARLEELDRLALQRALDDPGMTTHAAIVALQRTAGNRLVRRLLAERHKHTEGEGSHDQGKQLTPRRGRARALSGTPIQRVTIAETMWNYMRAHRTQTEALLRRLRQRYQGHNFTIAKVSNALLDVSFDLSGFRENDPDLAQVLIMSIAADLAENYSACYNLAAQLFGLIGSGAETAGPHNALRQQNGQGFRNNVQDLVNDIVGAAAAREEVVFRINYAGHGFALIVRPNEQGTMMVEHLESLAHTASLITSVRDRVTYRVENACEALKKMSNASEQTREEGAAEFGWNHSAIQLGAEFPQVEMRWWRRPLAVDWASRWQQAVQNRYATLGHAAGADLPAW